MAGMDDLDGVGTEKRFSLFLDRGETLVSRLMWLGAFTTVIACIALFALWMVFGKLVEIEENQQAGEIRGYKNRAATCYQIAALVGSQHLPEDCLAPELTEVLPGQGRPLFIAEAVPTTTATLNQVKTRELLCGYLRQDGDTGARFVLEYEKKTGERCEDPPRSA